MGLLMVIRVVIGELEATIGYSECRDVNGGRLFQGNPGQVNNAQMSRNLTWDRSDSSAKVANSFFLIIGYTYCE